MATTFYPSSFSIGIATYGNGATGKTALFERGASAASIAGTTTSGGTWISLGYFASQPLVEFSLSGTVTCNLRGAESSTQANASLGVRIYKWTKAAGLGASLGQASATVELGTTEGAVAATVTPTTTEFLSGDALVFEVGIINIGSMGNNRTVTFYFNGPTAAASGDSYITITPSVILQRRLTFTE
jgi:hypothetical protein